MSTSSGPFLSIVMATIRPRMMIEFLDMLDATAADPSSFEVLVKTDIERPEVAEAIQAHAPRLRFSCRVFNTPKARGYFSLHHGYGLMLKDSAPSSYFAWIMTDEMRISTPGWDRKLKPFVGFFPDHVFRLKPTHFNLKNYYAFEECINCPDNHPIVAKKWLQVAGGWGEFWAPDTWHQCMDYYFGMYMNKPYVRHRSLPIFEFKMSGLENSVSQEGRSEQFKVWMNIHGCHVFTARLGRENLRRIAYRLKAHIEAKARGLTEYILEEDYAARTVSTFTAERRNPISSFDYGAEYPEETWSINNAELALEEWNTRAGNPLQKAARLAREKPKLVYHYSDARPEVFPSGSEIIRQLMDQLTPLPE